MTYHTNHCTCNESCWENQRFDGKVMVYFEKTIETDTITYENNIEDPDYKNLISINNNYFDESGWNKRVELEKKYAKEDGTIFDLEKYEKRFKDNYEEQQIQVLNQEAIDWLNENIKDKRDSNENNPLNERKGWAIGSNDYIFRNNHYFVIFFERQIDALKFIRKFSIFKEPTFVFDCFADDRKELTPEKIINIINENTNKNLNINNYKFQEHEFETSTNLDYNTFCLKDWEKENKYDDLNLSKEEIETAIKEIYFVDNEDSQLNEIEM